MAAVQAKDGIAKVAIPGSILGNSCTQKSLSEICCEKFFQSVENLSSLAYLCSDSRICIS